MYNFFFLFFIFITHSLQASSKVTLKRNSELVYKNQLKDVSSLNQWLKESEIIFRARTNFFDWDWKDNSSTRVDNEASGIGGSIVVRTPFLNHLSLTVGAYTSQNPDLMRMEKSEVSRVRAGKDTFSRNQIQNGGRNDGQWGMNVLGLYHLDLKLLENSNLKVGRQIYESLYTRSNDTKMIPNTFDGASLEFTELSFLKRLRLAYFTAQKLRDHTSAHDVIAFRGTEENDDSGVNRSLTVERVGQQNKIVHVGVESVFSGFNSKFEVLQVPDILTHLGLQVGKSYKIGVRHKLTPTLRIMSQTDQLDDNFDRANLRNNHDGYRSANSLNSWLYAFRVDFEVNDQFKLRLGHSYVADQADFVAPWRGFPTGGFTRAMGQVNWNANTRSTMFQAWYSFNGALKGLWMSFRFSIQDFDDAKPGTASDSTVAHLDTVYEVNDTFQVKLRLASISAEDGIRDRNGALKADSSYDEARLETNYFF